MGTPSPSLIPPLFALSCMISSRSSFPHQFQPFFYFIFFCSKSFLVVLGLLRFAHGFVALRPLQVKTQIEPKSGSRMKREVTSVMREGPSGLSIISQLIETINKELQVRNKSLRSRQRPSYSNYAAGILRACHFAPYVFFLFSPVSFLFVKQLKN